MYPKDGTPHVAQRQHLLLYRPAVKPIRALTFGIVIHWLSALKLITPGNDEIENVHTSNKRLKKHLRAVLFAGNNIVLTLFLGPLQSSVCKIIVRNCWQRNETDSENPQRKNSERINGKFMRTFVRLPTEWAACVGPNLKRSAISYAIITYHIISQSCGLS